MDIKSLQNFASNPCMALREICDIVTDDNDDVVDVAYRVFCHVIAGNIKVLHGKIEDIISFVKKYERLNRCPIPRYNSTNEDGYVDEGYIDYELNQGDENYDSILGAAHEQYKILFNDYKYGIGTESYFSPLDVLKELKKTTQVEDVINTSGKKKYLYIIAMLLQEHASQLPLDGRKSGGVWERKLRLAGYPLDKKTIKLVLEEIKGIIDIGKNA